MFSVNAERCEGLPADLVHACCEKLFISHDSFDAVLQGDDCVVLFFAHALQVEDLVDGVFQGGVAHVGSSFSFGWLRLNQ